MTYIDGFVLPVPTKNLAQYKKMSKDAGKIWMKHGALGYMECEIDDPKAPFALAFPKLIKPKKGETILFSFITYKSRKHRDSVNKKVMADPKMGEECKEAEMMNKMPFDVKRMAYGGFKSIVEM